MKRIVTMGVLAALGIAAVVLFSQCELILGTGNANVIIDLGASGRAAAPTNIISYTLTVTAPDMAAIVKTVSAGARYLNMYVPYGNERTFRLDANLDPATQPSLGPDFLLSKAGERTVNLLPGRIVMLTFTMGAGETKMLIPDTYNTRLVEIPNLHPASQSDWSEYSSGTIQDIDFDKDGQLYYVMFDTNIYRLPSFSPFPSASPASSFSAIFPSSISIDISTTPSTVYFSAGTSVYSCPLGGSSPTLITLPSPPSLTTINAVRYQNGVLYGVGVDSLYTAILFRYVIGGSITSVSAPNGNYSWMDLIIKGNRVYVTNYPINSYTITDPANSASIDAYDKNTLARIGSYGQLTTTANDTRPGYFYGPRLFISKTSKKFYVIDDAYASGIGGNRIVSFDDPATWSGWETFRAEDLFPADEFRFFVPVN